MDDHAEGLALRIARFVGGVEFADLPPALVERAKLSLLDTIGVAMAGSASDGSSKVRRYVQSLVSGDGEATVLGTSLRTLPRFAALANGCAINTHDYDDTFLPSRTHSSGPVAAAILAQGEPSGCSGKAFLTAFAAGTEVTCKVSRAIDKQHFERGYHTTGTCGVVGATAGVCRLIEASTPVTAAALAIAASHAAGLRENFGSIAKVLHAGSAAENGVVAASLSQLGVTGSETIMEGPRGFFMALGGGHDPAVIAQLGDPWSYVSPGVAVKLYPSGNISHPAMWKLLELVVAHDIRPEQVRRISVKTNGLVPLNLTFHKPRTGLQAQLSMEFCLAIILTKRRAALADFADEVVTSAPLQDAMTKIDFSAYSDEEAAHGKYAFLTTFLDIEMNDGRRFSARADAAIGSAELPLSTSDVLAKYRACLEHARWPAAQIERSAGMILDLEHVADVRTLTALLRS